MLKKLPKLPFNRSFIVGLSDPTKLWLLYAVLFVFKVLIFTVERWEIYFFFGGGEKGEGKSSFADMGFDAGEAVCKCAFPFAVGLIVCFKNVFCRI